MGGGGGSNGLLNMGLMVAAGIAAPELAAEFAPEMMAAGGASGAAVGAATGAGLSGLTAAATGQNVLKSALMGGIGGAFTGYAPDVSGAANGAASSAAPLVTPAENLAPGLGASGYQGPIVDMEVPTQGANIGSPTPPVTPPPTVNPTPNMFGQVAGPTNSQLYTSAGINALGGLSKKPVGAYTPPNAIDTGGNLSKFKYDPNNYTPDTVVPPKPPYATNYSGMAAAKGGIMSLASGGPIPQSMVDQAAQQMLAQNQKNAPSSNLVASNNSNQFANPISAPAGYTMNSYDEYVPNQMPDTTNFLNIPNEELMQILSHNSMASGGITFLSSKNYAHGGKTYNLGDYSDGGRLLKGPGDGMSDDIPATIGHKQEARLADGEFVVPADVVSGLGNGSTDAGAKHLYKMMDKVRHARTGRKSQAKQIKGEKFVPA